MLGSCGFPMCQLLVSVLVSVLESECQGGAPLNRGQIAGATSGKTFELITTMLQQIQCKRQLYLLS